MKQSRDGPRGRAIVPFMIIGGVALLFAVPALLGRLHSAPVAAPRFGGATAISAPQAPTAAAARATSTPVAPTSSPTMAGATATPQPATRSVSLAAPGPEGLKAELLVLVNQFRARHGCAPLVADGKLMQAAEDHALDLALRGEVDHKGSDGSLLRDRLERVGYHGQLSGENIAAGFETPLEVLLIWTTGDEDPDGPHRKNLLNCSYSEAGVGLGYGRNSYSYWVLDMAEPQH